MFCLYARKVASHLYAKRSDQSILKEISPEYSLEGAMLKLKRQSFGHMMQRTDSFEKPLMLGQASSRGQAKDSALLSSRDAGLFFLVFVLFGPSMD